MLHAHSSMYEPAGEQGATVIRGELIRARVKSRAGGISKPGATALMHLVLRACARCTCRLTPQAAQAKHQPAWACCPGLGRLSSHAAQACHLDTAGWTFGSPAAGAAAGRAALLQCRPTFSVPHLEVAALKASQPVQAGVGGPLLQVVWVG